VTVDDLTDGPAADHDFAWSLNKIDIRSPVSPNTWPVARVELDHSVRGKVTDIGTAPGAFDAAFRAVGQIVGISPKLCAYNVRSSPPGEDGALPIEVEIVIEHDQQIRSGKSSGVDLVRCSLLAWLDALRKLKADDVKLS
jgi:2-isopropylmalate synthase